MGRHLKIDMLTHLKLKMRTIYWSRIDDDRPLGKYETIWTEIEDLKKTGLNALPVYVRYIKTKIRAYGNKVYISFCGLIVPEDYIECESFTVISINSLLVYKSKYYIQVYLDNCDNCGQANDIFPWWQTFWNNFLYKWVL